MLFHLKKKKGEKTAFLKNALNVERNVLYLLSYKEKRSFGLLFSFSLFPFLFTRNYFIFKNLCVFFFQMIPDSESVCQTSEAAVRSTDDVYRKIKNVAEGEAASVTAWKRYQQLVAIVESRGGKFNRKSMIEAIFRGNDLVYASHWSFHLSISFQIHNKLQFLYQSISIYICMYMYNNSVTIFVERILIARMGSRERK